MRRAILRRWRIVWASAIALWVFEWIVRRIRFLLAIDGLDRMPTNRNSSWNACEMNWLALLLRRGSSYGKRSPSPNRWFSSRVTRCIIVWSPLRLRPPSAKGAFVDVNWAEFMSYIVFRSPKSVCQQIVRQTILVPKIWSPNQSCAMSRRYSFRTKVEIQKLNSIYPQESLKTC